MKIDSSTIGMESARSYHASNATVRRFSIMDYQQSLAQGGNSLNAAISEEQGDTQDKSSGAADKRNTTMQEWQNRFQVSSNRISIHTSASQAFFEIRETSLRYIFDMLFASRRNRLNQWSSGNSGQSALGGNQVSGVVQNNDAQNANTVFTSNMKVLNYTQESWQMEQENTSFSTVGTVRTSDGREIKFNVNVGMSREFEQYYKEDFEMASFQMCDPLVINLDTDVAELSDQKFFFDIDADGEMDEVSMLGGGSGYLALDKNGDGTINDGSELFGTSSGNGFKDLAKYDDDGNGWIDENDEIWSKLKIWCKDENGQDVLYRLADKGVGAICLQNVSTDFTLKGQDNQTNGAIRNTGVFLYENGTAGTVQHVDVAKYAMEA